MPGTMSSFVVKGALIALAMAGLAPTPDVAASEQASEAKTPEAASTVREPHPRQKTLMKRQWGVEVLFVRQTSAGYMLEFRYKVLDPEKAKPLFEHKTKPVLTHVESGARFIVPTPPKTGALRNSNMPLEGHTYWMFFANPDQFIKPGDLVTIEIGDFVAKNIVVK
jgi:hypothetical protein